MKTKVKQTFEVVRRHKDTGIRDVRFRWSVKAKDDEDALAYVRETYVGDVELEDKEWELVVEG